MQFLQVCPKDHPPFKDICSYYGKAARQIGLSCTTIFLQPPASTPLEGDDVFYLQAGEQLQTLINRLVGDPTLIISHRYRAWRQVQATNLKPGKHIFLAHEFGAFRTWRRRLRLRVSKGATQLAGVSSAVSLDLQRQTGREAIVIPNVVDTLALDKRRLSREAAREKLGLPQEGRVIGVVGRLHWWKQPQLALAGFASANLADTHLCFVGSGKEEAALRDMDKNLGTNARFCGFVEDAPACFKAFDQLLVTSTEREAFGMMTIEALSAGVPVLSSDQPALREVLGDLGTYIKPLTVAGVAQALQETSDVGTELDLDVLKDRVERLFSINALSQKLAELIAR